MIACIVIDCNKIVREVDLRMIMGLYRVDRYRPFLPVYLIGKVSYHNNL